MEVKNFLPVIYFLLGLSIVFAMTGYVSEGDTISSVGIDGLRIFADTFNGTTTTFTGLSTAELNNMSSLTLEKTAYGKVVFNEIINLTQVAGADRIVDFDSDFNISNNLVYIDSSDLPYMNKLATVSIYGLSFTDPQIIKGASICSDCTEVSYSSGTLIFTTTSFSSAYYARETPAVDNCGNGVCDAGETTATCPVDCPADTGGGGGGGGGGGDPEEGTPLTGYDFYVEPTFFTLRMNRGEYFQKNILVVNNGSKDLNISVYVSGVHNFVFPQEHVVSVNAGQNKTLRLDIYVSESRPVDVYVGKIVFASAYVTREVKAILDVEEANALFDIRTDILKRYVTPGGRVRANISIINMGSLRNFDVSLEYRAVDFEGNNYTIKKEDFAMDQSYFNIFFLELPKDIPIGDYVFYARVNYGEVGASSFDTFTVEKISWLAWMVVIIIVLMIIFLIIRRLTRDRRLAKKAFREQQQKPRIVKKPLIIRKLRMPKLPEY